MALSLQEKNLFNCHMLNGTTVNITDCFEEWRYLKQLKGIATDRDMCRYLLDIFYRQECSETKSHQIDTVLHDDHRSYGVSESSHTTEKGDTYQIKDSESTDTDEGEMEMVQHSYRLNTRPEDIVDTMNHPTRIETSDVLEISHKIQTSVESERDRHRINKSPVSDTYIKVFPVGEKNPTIRYTDDSVRMSQGSSMIGNNPKNAHMTESYPEIKSNCDNSVVLDPFTDKKNERDLMTIHANDVLVVSKSGTEITYSIDRTKRNLESTETEHGIASSSTLCGPKKSRIDIISQVTELKTGFKEPLAVFKDEISAKQCFAVCNESGMTHKQELKYTEHVDISEDPQTMDTSDDLDTQNIKCSPCVNVTTPYSVLKSAPKRMVTRNISKRKLVRSGETQKDDNEPLSKKKMANKYLKSKSEIKKDISKTSPRIRTSKVKAKSKSHQQKLNMSRKVATKNLKGKSVGKKLKSNLKRTTTNNVKGKKDDINWESTRSKKKKTKTGEKDLLRSKKTNAATNKKIRPKNFKDSAKKTPISKDDELLKSRRPNGKATKKNIVHNSKEIEQSKAAKKNNNKNRKSYETKKTNKNRKGNKAKNCKELQETNETRMSKETNKGKETNNETKMNNEIQTCNESRNVNEIRKNKKPRTSKETKVRNKIKRSKEPNKSNKIRKSKESTSLDPCFAKTVKRKQIQSRNKKGCSVGNCGTLCGRGYSFHGLPRDELLRQKWIDAVRTSCKFQNPNPFSRLCSLHFTEDCFERSCLMKVQLGISKKPRMILKPGVVPTIFENVNFHEDNEFKGTIRGKALPNTDASKEVTVKLGGVAATFQDNCDLTTNNTNMSSPSANVSKEITEKSDAEAIEFQDIGSSEVNLTAKKPSKINRENTSVLSQEVGNSNLVSNCNVSEVKTTDESLPKSNLCKKFVEIIDYAVPANVPKVALPKAVFEVTQNNIKPPNANVITELIVEPDMTYSFRGIVSPRAESPTNLNHVKTYVIKDAKQVAEKVQKTFTCKQILPNKCVAGNCHNIQTPSISLFNFPCDEPMRQQWISAVKMTRRGFYPTASSLLCSDHFTKDCFELSGRLRAEFGIYNDPKLKLNQNAVPTIFKDSSVDIDEDETQREEMQNADAEMQPNCENVPKANLLLEIKPQNEHLSEASLYKEYKSNPGKMAPDLFQKVTPDVRNLTNAYEHKEMELGTGNSYKAGVCEETSSRNNLVKTGGNEEVMTSQRNQPSTNFILQNTLPRMTQLACIQRDILQSHLIQSFINNCPSLKDKKKTTVTAKELQPTSENKSLVKCITSTDSHAESLSKTCTENNDNLQISAPTSKALLENSVNKNYHQYVDCTMKPQQINLVNFNLEKQKDINKTFEKEADIFENEVKDRNLVMNQDNNHVEHEMYLENESPKNAMNQENKTPELGTVEEHDINEENKNPDNVIESEHVIDEENPKHVMNQEYLVNQENKNPSFAMDHNEEFNNLNVVNNDLILEVSKDSTVDSNLWHPLVPIDKLPEDMLNNCSQNKKGKRKHHQKSTKSVVDDFVAWSDVSEFSDQFSEVEEGNSATCKAKCKKKSDSEFELSSEEASSNSDDESHFWTVTDRIKYEETMNDTDCDNIFESGDKSKSDDDSDKTNKEGRSEKDTVNQHPILHIDPMRKNYMTRTALRSKTIAGDQHDPESIENSNDIEVDERTIQECFYCGFVAPEKRELYSHLKLKHGIEYKKIAAEERATTLARKKKTSKSSKIHLCSACAHTCTGKQALVDHVYAMHHESGTEPPPRYKCEDCGKSFHYKRYLWVHRSYSKCNRNIRSANCSCSVCGEKFWGSNEVKKHKQIVHGIYPRKNFKCMYCEKSFICSKSLNCHVNGKHLKKYIYKCPYEDCDKSFTRRWSLKVHVRLHTDEKPLTCEYCGYSCRQKNALDWHIKAKHINGNETS